MTGPGPLSLAQQRALDRVGREVRERALWAVALLVALAVTVWVAAGGWARVLPDPVWWAIAGGVAVCCGSALRAATAVATERAILAGCRSCLEDAVQIGRRHDHRAWCATQRHAAPRGDVR